MVIAQGGPRGGDIGNRFGGQVFHSAFCCALAIDQLIIGHTVCCQKIAHKAVVFRGNPQAKPVGCAKRGGGGIQIIKAVDIDPRIRHRDDQVGLTKAKRCKLCHLICPIDQTVAHKVRPGDTQMNAPCSKFARNLASRQQHQIYAINSVDSARIFPHSPGLAHGNAALAEPIKRLFHQAAFGRHSDLQGHRAPLFNAATRPGRMMPPTAGIDRPCPRTAVNAS